MPRPRYRRSSGPRRSTFWTGMHMGGGSVLAPGGQSSVELTQDMPVAGTNDVGRKGMTIIRAFIHVRVNSTHASLSVEGSFGLIMVDGDARAGLTLPDPDLDHGAGWLYWARREFLPPSDSGQHFELDIRAKRKFRGNDDGLMFVIDNDDAAQSLEFVVGGRVLIMR